MGKGGGSSTTSTELPQWLQTNLQDVYKRADTLSQQPLNQYTAPTTAGFTGSQNAAFNTINNAQGISTPFTNAAAQYTAQSAQGPTAADIQQYQSPYTQQVVDATQAQLNQNNAVQQQQLMGKAIQSGASPFGGDRAGVAAAALAGQQKMSDNSTIANLYNQGYGQALGQYNTTAGMQAQAGQAMNQYGTTAQDNALTGANAQLQAGNQQQALAQQQLNTPYEQFQAQQQHPYQQLGVLENATGLAGGLAGGTSKTTTNYADGGIAHFAAGGAGNIPDLSTSYIPKNSFTKQGSSPRLSIPQAPQLPKPEDPLAQGANFAGNIKGAEKLYGYGKDAVNWGKGQLGLDKAAVDTATYDAAPIAAPGSITSTELAPLASPGADGVAASIIPESQTGILSAPLAEAATPAMTAADTAFLGSAGASAGTAGTAAAAAPAIEAGLGAGAAGAGAGAAGATGALEAGSSLLGAAGPIGLGLAVALPLLSKLFRADGGVAHYANGGSAKPTASAYYPKYADGGESATGVAAKPQIATPQLDVSKLNGKDTSSQNYFNPLPQIDMSKGSYAPVGLNDPAAYMGYNSGSSNTGVGAPVYGSHTTIPMGAQTQKPEQAARTAPLGIPDGAKQLTSGNYANYYYSPQAPGSDIYNLYDPYTGSLYNPVMNGRNKSFFYSNEIGLAKGGIAHFADGGDMGIESSGDSPLEEDTIVPREEKYYAALPKSPELDEQIDGKSKVTDLNGKKAVQHGDEMIDTGLDTDLTIPLLAAGFSALAGSSKSPMVNLSRGALTGIGAYTAQQKMNSDIAKQNSEITRNNAIGANGGSSGATMTAVRALMEADPTLDFATAYSIVKSGAGQGRTVRDGKLVPIDGALDTITESEAAKVKGKRDAKLAADKKESLPAATSSLIGAEDSAHIVEDAINTAKQQANFWSTGAGADTLATVGGTQAKDLHSTLQTIKSNIGFDKLAAMRASSKTGGALGNVSDFENKQLQSVIANLEQSQSEAQFKKNLETVRTQYRKSMKNVKEAYKLDYGTTEGFDKYFGSVPSNQGSDASGAADKPTGGGKSFSQNDVANAAKKKGVTVDQMMQALKDKGITVQ